MSSPLVVLALLGWTRHAARYDDAGEVAWAEESRAHAARSRNALAIAQLWGDFDRACDARSSTLGAFQSWLDERGLPATHTQVIDVEWGLDAAPGDALVGLTRADVASEVRLSARASVAGQLEPSHESEAWAVRPRGWDGAEFTLLGRNLSCALCHVTVLPDRAAPVALGGGAAPGRGRGGGEGLGERAARVGVLGDLVLRSDARVAVHGTLHLGGALRDGVGGAIAPDRCAALRFAALDADLRLVPEGRLEPLQALDLMRLQAQEGRLLARHDCAPRTLARRLPDSFPAFDDVQPCTAALGAAGAAIAEGAGLAGGRGGWLALDAALSDDDAGRALPALRRHPGHLWAVGTEADPLRLDGDVEVTGDALLSGWIEGVGTLRVRGMLLIAGSLRTRGHIALVAGSDILAGAAVDADGLARFAQEAAGGPISLPPWVPPARVRRMGDREPGALTIEAFLYAPRHVIVVAPRRATAGDVRVRGGLVSDTVAVHAPGELTLMDDPRARALLRFRAPRGLELRRIAPVREGAGSGDPAPWSIDSEARSVRSARPTPDPR
ncbi:MAG: hypothetical protein R3F49_09645 [Planctomycetota bacterium]